MFGSLPLRWSSRIRRWGKSPLTLRRPNAPLGVCQAGSPSPPPPRFCWRSRSASAAAISICHSCSSGNSVGIKRGLFEAARDFPWTVPVAHAVLLLIPGVAIAAVSRLRPRFVSLRAASWLFATLAIWAALLRLPLYGACSLLLAAGLGRPISDAVASRGWHPRTVRYTLAGLLGLLGVLAALSSGRQAIREHLAVAGLPPPPPGARNVVLIVWDTVRAYNLSPYGYPRNTTPNLAQCARPGRLV